MDNPWLGLPKRPPFVLPEDRIAVSEFNGKAARKFKLETCLYPEPFFGNPHAPVVLLLLNPGVADADFTAHKNPKFGGLARVSLSHTLSPHPFLHLNPSPILNNAPGAQWWRRKTRRLRERVESAGDFRHGDGLLCLELYPYHSKEFGGHRLELRSQKYTLHLLTEAMNRNAIVVVMRAWKRWLEAVPRLEHYPSDRLWRVKNPQNPALSPANLGDDNFKGLVGILAASRCTS